MNVKTDIPYYLIAIITFIFLKFVYTSFNNEDIDFLLNPVNRIVGIIKNSNSEYLSGIGYYHKELDIIIDKSCSGFNFWVLCFIMLSFLSLKFLNKKTYKFLAIPIILLFTYFTTIIVNTSRILLSIFSKNVQGFFPDKNHSLIHQAEGTFIYLFFLIIIYLTSEFIFKKLSHYYAKFT